LFNGVGVTIYGYHDQHNHDTELTIRYYCDTKACDEKLANNYCWLK